MNNEGKIIDIFNNVKTIVAKIKNSYIYRLVSKIISVICTIILILLLITGAIMFYFNYKAKASQAQGIDYTAPIGLYTIISGSMEPNVSVYDVVISSSVNDLSTVKTGDIITFISDWDLNYGVTVTHRVVSISKTEDGEYQFVTKGDNNPTADGAVVTQKNLIGKVVMRIPQLGRIQFFLATKMGWFIVVLVPALGIIIYDLIKLFKLFVIRKNIVEVKSTTDADKIFFGNEILDSKDMNDFDLMQTIRPGTLKVNPTYGFKIETDKPKIDLTEIESNQEVVLNTSDAKQEIRKPLLRREEIVRLPKIKEDISNDIIVSNDEVKSNIETTKLYAETNDFEKPIIINVDKPIIKDNQIEVRNNIIENRGENKQITMSENSQFKENTNLDKKLLIKKKKL